MSKENVNAGDRTAVSVGVSDNTAVVAGSPTVVTDRVALAKLRQSFNLHVFAIMRQHGLTKSQAMVQAYHEGVEGIARRIK